MLNAARASTETVGNAPEQWTYGSQGGFPPIHLNYLKKNPCNEYMNIHSNKIKSNLATKLFCLFTHYTDNF